MLSKFKIKSKHLKTSESGTNYYRVSIYYNGDLSKDTPYCMGKAYKDKPNINQVFYSLAHDALNYRAFPNLDDFASEFDITKPSEAIKMWDSCKGTSQWMDRVGLDPVELLEYLEVMTDEEKNY